jgi:DNA-binding LytR/AlgR family response regulator
LEVQRNIKRLDNMNCIIVDDDNASISIFKQLAKQVGYLNILQSYSSPLEAISSLRKEDVDVLFLDIEMPEMNGMDMLKALDNRPHVILTTSHKDYALDAYELNVVDYLIKPLTLPRLVKALTKVKALSDIKDQVSAEKDYFFIKKDSVLTKVPVKDILWIEALGDYVTLNTKDYRFVLHVTLKSVEGKLPANKFVRVHRCYIVHIDNIRTVEDATIFINETSIPIGALYKDNFIKRLNTLQ